MADPKPWENPQPVPGPRPVTPTPPPYKGSIATTPSKSTSGTRAGGQEQSWGAKPWDWMTKNAGFISDAGTSAGMNSKYDDNTLMQARLVASLWLTQTGGIPGSLSDDDAVRLLKTDIGQRLLAQFYKEVGGTGTGTGKSAEELALEARQIAANERANAIAALTADIDNRLKQGQLTLDKAKMEYEQKITALSNQANAINQAQSQFQEAVGWAGTGNDQFFPGFGPEGPVANAMSQAGLPWQGLATEPAQFSPGAIVGPTQQGVQVANQGVNFNPADLDAVLEQSMNQLRNYGNG